MVVAIMHDCASANKVVMHSLEVLYPTLLEISCFSHTLNCVGEKFMLMTSQPIYWVSLFSYSFKARVIQAVQLVTTALLACYEPNLIQKNFRMTLELSYLNILLHVR